MSTSFDDAKNIKKLFNSVGLCLTITKIKKSLFIYTKNLNHLFQISNVNSENNNTRQKHW